MTTHLLDARALMAARRNLTAFAHTKATQTEAAVGFGFRPSAMSPNTYDKLRREFRASEITKLPLRISSLHCDTTIYLTPEANMAFRFWHDCAHVRLGFSFSDPDELALGAWHLEQLRAAGYAADTLEHRLLHADTVGQAYSFAVTGRFVRHQLHFALACVTRGLDAAVELERPEAA